MEKYEMKCVEKMKIEKENADGTKDTYKTTFSDEVGNKITVFGEQMEVEVNDAATIKFDKPQQKL